MFLQLNHKSLNVYQAEISRGSIVEIDAVLETAVDVGFLKKEELNGVGEKLNKCLQCCPKC